jgi:hypothetical protein
MITITDEGTYLKIESDAAGVPVGMITKASIVDVRASEVRADLPAAPGPATNQATLRHGAPAELYINVREPHGSHRWYLSEIADIDGTTVFASAEAAADAVRALL